MRQNTLTSSQSHCVCIRGYLFNIHKRPWVPTSCINQILMRNCQKDKTNFYCLSECMNAHCSSIIVGINFQSIIYKLTKTCLTLVNFQYEGLKIHVYPIKMRKNVDITGDHLSE